MDRQNKSWLHNKLGDSSDGVLTLYAVVAAFITYFAMYAFRKPFAAAAFEGAVWFGGEVSIKAVLASSQLIGYALSKIVGIKVCSELDHAKRGVFLVGIILLAELSLLCFGLVPDDWKFIAIGINGLALGLVWGVVVTFLEGRKTSEIMLAGLSCAFIMASGVVKDFGRAVMAGSEATWWHGTPVLSRYLVEWYGPVSEGWMPFVVGLHYLPVFVIAVILLKQLPAPNKLDIAERSERKTMSGAERGQFFTRFAGGICMLCFIYLFMTAYRDYRDTYQVEIFGLLGYEASAENKSLLGNAEMIVAFAVTIGLGALYWLRHLFHQHGLVLVWGFMTLGMLALGGGTLLYDSGMVSGFTWMVLTGVGVYLTYVPFGSVLFDQIIASTRFVGTAVFAIYLCDGVGYIGTVGLYFVGDLLFGEMNKLEFFHHFTHLLTVGGLLCLCGSYLYFRKCAMLGEMEAEVESQKVLRAGE
ncbi:DUF5690 family protein [Rubritalea tangerina]|uniref:DUF5690 family protein n=1 Tax=Rubritalea tangerina TaxID=430798 RepID=A0ABW4ZCJ4_9BACT